MINMPWLKSYGSVPHQLEYPDCSMFELVAQTAQDYPEGMAYEFMGQEVSYPKLIEEIEECAKALKALGIQEDERVTICLPNVPQAIIMFYAVNRVGAVANMIHPLSSEGEIEFFLRDSNSIAAITLDLFYPKFAAIREKTPLKCLLITSVKDKLGPLMTAGFVLTKGRKIKPIPPHADVVYWKDFLDGGKKYLTEGHVVRTAQDPAAILYSGGTSGTTKGILLSNLNFNALAMQTLAMGQCIDRADSMLAIMPVFHGFGLGVCIHTMLHAGAKCILIPEFNSKTFGDLLKKKKPNHIAGVPTLFEAMLRNQSLQKADLHWLKGVFSGGDSLSIELKKKVDTFLQEHGTEAHIREGYGLTESVTASCLTPKHREKEGSIGLPFPDTYYKIVKPNTQEELPYGVEGEICLTGPTLMAGYVGNPKETAHALQEHSDGCVWLHTGDLGMMDEEGFIYYRQRLKRVIISSGYTIFPSQLENVIDAHPSVLMSTVIGVDDPYKMQKVKAFVVLQPKVPLTDALKQDIRAHCEKNIAKYAMPYEFEYRESLPKTLVGKVAYTILEAEERQKAKSAPCGLKAAADGKEE